MDGQTLNKKRTLRINLSPREDKAYRKGNVIHRPLSIPEAMRGLPIVNLAIRRRPKAPKTVNWKAKAKALERKLAQAQALQTTSITKLTKHFVSPVHHSVVARGEGGRL